MTQYHDTAEKVAKATAAHDAGVVIAVERGDVYRYVIWAIGTNGRITDHKLTCSVTDEARLEAHARGFIENHLRAFA